MEKITALVLVRLIRYTFEEFLAAVEKLPNIKRYSVITGEFDGVIEIEVDTMEKLYETFTNIEKIKGIERTNTHIVLKQFNFA